MQKTCASPFRSRQPTNKAIEENKIKNKENRSLYPKYPDAATVTTSGYLILKYMEKNINDFP